MRILLVEDNRRLNQSLKQSLTEDGYAVDSAFTGPDGEELAAMTPFDAIILDVMLPGKDGMAVCRELRKQRVTTPILMLTARDAVDDRITGLDTGADDYVLKPFDFGELFARVRALARRGPVEREPVLRVGDLSLDLATRTVRRGDVEISLSTKELQLLEVFMRRPGQVLSRVDLLEGAWEMEYENRSNVVDVYVRYLRDKIDRPFAAESLETVRGAGYRLREG